jgi:hypothetical protein
LSTPRDEIPLRPPNLSARDAAYGGGGPVQVIRDPRPKPTPAPGAVDLLATLVEQLAGLRSDVFAINERLNAIEAAQERRFAEVRTYVLGLHDRLYDLHDAIEDHDNATRPDAAVISLIHNPDTTNEEE